MAARHELGLLELEGARLLAAEGGDERVARVEDAEAGADEAHQDNGDVDGLLVPAQRAALDAQVEVRRPDEREHVAGDAAD